MTEPKTTIRWEDQHDSWLEALHAAFNYVPLSQYDEVTKLAHYAVDEMLSELSAAQAALAALEELNDSVASENERYREALEQIEALKFGTQSEIARAALTTPESPPVEAEEEG